MRMRQKTLLTAFAIFLLGFSVSEAALESTISHILFQCGPYLEDIHSNEFHALKAESRLHKDGQDGQEPVGSNVVDQPSTCDGAWIVPVLEPPSLSVRSTTEGNDKTGDDEHNNQGDWKKLQIVRDIQTEGYVKTLLFIKEK